MTKPRLSLFGLIPLVALIALSGMLLYRLENPRASGSVDSPLIGHPLPDLGTPIQGPAIVNVFASWCAPCKIEHPYLLVAKSRGAKIVGIAYKDTPANIDQYIQTMGNPYDAQIMDPNGTRGITLGITGVPESFLVDAQGIVRKRLQGPFTSVPDVMDFMK